VTEAQQYVPSLRRDALVSGPAGVRAQPIARDGSFVDEFVFFDSERSLHVRAAPSPAATSALAIAQTIADRAERRFEH
jgi:L-2-hydroxyglutarate oxidase LhgO